MIICPYCHSSYLRDHPEQLKEFASGGSINNVYSFLKCGICGLVLSKKDARRLKDAKTEGEYQDIKKHVLKSLINH